VVFVLFIVVLLVGFFELVFLFLWCGLFLFFWFFFFFLLFWGGVLVGFCCLFGGGGWVGLGWVFFCGGV
ncbi:hypothetical protein PUR71_08800, partial [Streptomyces sp. SP17BM10]|uniref:hypothetical protein n=1 Tax=Streptomyces sp. SP17BM10 TaxID=3002530 RepID=UPI002E76BFD5